MLSDESTLMRSINNASTYGSFYCADPGTIFHMLVSLRWLNGCQRPYRNEYTGSLPNSEVNRCRARSVLGWGTAWEVLRVLLAFSFYSQTLVRRKLVSHTKAVSLLTYLCQGMQVSQGELGSFGVAYMLWFLNGDEGVARSCCISTVAILAQGTISWLATRSPF